MLRQLLLLPLLAPLLAVMLVGAVNPRPLVSLRLLTWSTPPLPIGLWILLAAGGGGLLSAGSTTLALRAGAAGSGGASRSQRQVRRPLRERESDPRPDAEPRWSEPVGRPAGPSRPPGEPAPTVAVPFRVVRRPQRQQAAAGMATEPSAREPAGDWGDPGGDDW